MIFKRMAIQTDVDYAKQIGLVLDSGINLGCDVPSTNPPIHLCNDGSKGGGGAGGGGQY